MTTDKAFKRVVRARMAKTGERYAAARRTLVEGATDAEPTADPATPSGYRMRGGLHPETATLANVLANQGVVSGVTGKPLTEAAILGIGGGLGAGYILWEFKARGGAILTLGFRNQWQYPSIPGWTGRTLERLDIEPDLHETGGARALGRRSMPASTPGRTSSHPSTSSRSAPGACLTCCRATAVLSSSSSDVTPMARTSWMTVAGTHSACHRP
jgi:hypothetical protein